MLIADSEPVDPVDRYLVDLLDQAAIVLGDHLAGAYLGGSRALNAYRPDGSDVDVALVVTDPLTDLVRHALVARLRHEALPCPARGLELVVYRQDIAASGTSEPAFELELNTGTGMDFRATYRPEDRPAEDGHFWYAIDRSILREHGVALYGPPAAEVFAEVAELQSLLADSVRWHLARPGVDDAMAGVLGAYRALIRIRTGRWVAKPEAARVMQEKALRELIAG